MSNRFSNALIRLILGCNYCACVQLRRVFSLNNDFEKDKDDRMHVAWGDKLKSDQVRRKEGKTAEEDKRMEVC